MSEKGFTGISFPFRIGVKGGVALSSTSVSDAQHIIEAMTQILGTRLGERCMEYHFYSEVDTAIFEPNDTSSSTLIAYQVKEALKKLEDRISVKSVTITSEDTTIYAEIHFTILAYNTAHVASIKVGDLSV